MSRECSTHGRDEKCVQIFCRKPETKRPVGRLRRVYGRIMLELILRKWVGRCGLDASGSGDGRVLDYCEHDNKPSGCMLTE